MKRKILNWAGLCEKMLVSEIDILTLSAQGSLHNLESSSFLKKKFSAKLQLNSFKVSRYCLKPAETLKVVRKGDYEGRMNPAKRLKGQNIWWENWS